MTHTPAPWKIANGPTYCAIRTTDRVIADLRFVNQHYNQADSVLIAAAPDLLEACIEALSLFDNYPETWEAIGTYQVLLNAIKKAQ
jgi:hypothetical protein